MAFFWLGKKLVVLLLVHLKLRQGKASFLILLTNLHNLLRHRWPWNTSSCTQPKNSELETAVKAVEITSFQGRIEAGLEHKNTHCYAKRGIWGLTFSFSQRGTFIRWDTTIQIHFQVVTSQVGLENIFIPFWYTLFDA